MAVRRPPPASGFRRQVRMVLTALLWVPLGLALAVPVVLSGALLLAYLYGLLPPYDGPCRYDAARARAAALAAYEDLRRRNAHRPDVRFGPIDVDRVAVERGASGYRVSLPLRDGRPTWIGMASCAGGLEFAGTDRPPRVKEMTADRRRPPAVPPL